MFKIEVWILQKLSWDVIAEQRMKDEYTDQQRWREERQIDGYTVLLGKLAPQAAANQ